jgi:hypothetical protein
MGGRSSISLDGPWRFVADPERLYGPGELPAGDTISVPGCWEAQVARPYRIINAWYHRTLDLPGDWRPDGRRVILRFGAVMYRCGVWVNGQHVGGHEGGYTPFELDITDELRWDGRDAVQVAVTNPLNGLDEYPAFSVAEVLLAEEWEPDLPLAEAPHGKQTWYSSQSGIWQSVSLECRPALALGPLHVRPDVPGGRAIVRWSLHATGDGRSVSRDGATLELRITGPDGAEVARETVAVDAEDGGETAIPIPDVRLWDIDQPNLYRVTARLTRAGGTELDEVSARFGMREIRTEDGKVILNGRPIYLLAALDQDLYPETISTPPSREYLDRQVRLAREMGLNLLRCHIKVPDPAYLDAADEAGILLWCELPNWTRFTSTAAARGRDTLAAMVEAMGNHPSIVIWTIINEDWGTQLRYEARDRHWLRETFDWLKELDPSRLVVDNSACETPQTPNFHLKTDLLDFHVYFLAPDNAVRWRQMIDDFARRPSWLWSPHGDADPTGDEPLVLSEFGQWGLPRLDRLVATSRREPWWFRTGRYYYRPAGLRRRFSTYGLDRIWPSVEALAEATQWHQFDALQHQIGRMRRHASIQGFVVTELSDAYWEANGLLDPDRGTKVYHDRLPEFLAEDVVVIDPERRDVCAEEPCRFQLTISSYGEAPPSGRGRVEWTFTLGDGRSVAGGTDVATWPSHTAVDLGWHEADVPAVESTMDGILRARLLDDTGRERAAAEMRFAVLTPAARHTARPRRVAVHDPLDIWQVADRVAALGHEVVPIEEADLLVTTESTPELSGWLESGGRALMLIRSGGALPADHDLARRVSVHLRRQPHSGWPGQRSPWEGDWVTSWSWILPGTFPGLPDRAPLDFAYEEVLPDHVLLGYDPTRHRDEVPSGMFVGWVHTPAANVWRFRQARGAVTLTTFRVAPESGPVASALLEGLIQQAADADRRSDTSERRSAAEVGA